MQVEHSQGGLVLFPVRRGSPTSRLLEEGVESDRQESERARGERMGEERVRRGEERRGEEMRGEERRGEGESTHPFEDLSTCS